MRAQVKSQGELGGKEKRGSMGAGGSGDAKRGVKEELEGKSGYMKQVFFFFVSLVTGPTRSLSLKWSDARVYEPQT